MDMDVPQILEAVMLICFGIGWPVDILKQLRTRQTAGKSLGFMSIVFIGYLAGLGSKFVFAGQNGVWPAKVTWLYLLNTVMVGLDIALYLKFRKAAQKVQG